ncbi:MAG: PAS domain-containing protein [Rhodobacteraceae bacterium]|nr:PAS domain-containing protein [Paracoccaceae bacterium]
MAGKDRAAGGCRGGPGAAGAAAPVAAGAGEAGRGVWAALPVPALVIDAEGRIVAANPAAEIFLNASARALAGRLLSDRLPVSTPIDEALARARAGLAAIAIHDAVVVTHERAPVPATLHLGPFDDRPGHVLVVVSPSEHAGRLGRGGAGPAARRAIGMAEMLAHEIRNPLAGISGAAQLLAMGLAGPDRELTGLIVEETRRIVLLLEEVEEFGRQRPPRPGAVNLHDLAERARRSAAVGFAAHMTIVTDYDPSLPAARADPDQILQVLLNLLRNAAEASPGGGTIRLRSFYEPGLRRRRGDGVGEALPLALEVIDDGPGVPPAIAGEVFEPFVSGRADGTGLGLALVARIIADHGGLVTLDSAPGRTVVRLSLPVARGAAAEGTGEGTGKGEGG